MASLRKSIPFLRNSSIDSSGDWLLHQGCSCGPTDPPVTTFVFAKAARSAESQMQSGSTIQTGDALSRFNTVPREVLLACRLSDRSYRRLIPAGIRIAGETLAHF